MTTEEIIQTLKTAQAEVEWEYPMDYAVAIDEAIEAVYVRDEVEKKLKSHHLRIELKETLTTILERAKERVAEKHYWIIFGDYLKCPVCGHYFKKRL